MISSTDGQVTSNKIAMLAAMLVMTASSATSAAAAEGEQTISVAITGGTLGIGPQIGYRFNERFGIRGDATFLSVSRSLDVEGLTYDGTLKLQSYGVTIDVYPFGGRFRVSGGARINKNHAPIRTTPTDEVEIGGDVYQPQEVGTLSGVIRTKDFAPALTLGYGGGSGKGFMFGIDAGVLFQGQPRINDLSATGTLKDDPSFQESLAREELLIEDEIDNYNLYPIVQLSLGWRF